MVRQPDGKAIHEKIHTSWQEADEFFELLDSDWADHTGTVAEVRHNRQQLLQSTQDITTRSWLFLELLDSDWADHTGTVAEVRYNRQQLLQSTRDTAKLKDYCEVRYNRQQLLQSTRDIAKLKDYCERMSLRHIVLLFHRVLQSADTFSKLTECSASVALCQLTAFNNRRPQQPAKLVLDKYNKPAI